MIISKKTFPSIYEYRLGKKWVGKVHMINFLREKV